jgi:hypothetical protein
LWIEHSVEDELMSAKEGEAVGLNTFSCEEQTVGDPLLQELNCEGIELKQQEVS